MALGTNHVRHVEASSDSRTLSNSSFIRELWSDEIIAAYKANLVMPALVVNMNHSGKKGDTIHVPRPNRGSASRKATTYNNIQADPAAEVVLIRTQETQTPYHIDQWWEYSRLIEDIVTLQADDSLRAFYTDDAGYALAIQVDTDLHAEGAKFNGAAVDNIDPTVASSAYGGAVTGTPNTGELVKWDPTGDGNATPLSDLGIRLAIQKLDDSDVPSMGRCLVIPPVEKKNLTGIARFTEQAFVGEIGNGNTIRNGLVGDVYGVEIYVSSNCATPLDANSNATTSQRACLFFQKEALLHIEQLAPRTQTQYKQEYLGDLFTADMVYGKGVLRPENGIAMIVPA